MAQNFLIYGANGYTGELTARLAVERGLKPILAGRSLDKIEPVARRHGLEARGASLDSPEQMDRMLAGVSAVLHCAGPFSHTYQAMFEACARNHAHYLDITGELQVFEALQARDAEAKAAGILVMPGAGFDVVPTDCMAAYLKSRLPDATNLALGFHGIGGRISHGTATTAIENLHKGGMVRRDGAIQNVPTAWKSRSIDFGKGPVRCMTIPWGDISTAYWSTHIPNIEVYLPTPTLLRWLAVASRAFGPILGTAPVQSLLKRLIRTQPRGPSEEERQRAFSIIWGEVQNAKGQTASARLQTPEGYTLTALASLAAIEKILSGNAPVGYQTPSSAYGADFVLQVPGVERKDA